MECSLCTSTEKNPYCPMCNDPPPDPELVVILKMYLTSKYPEEDNQKMAEHLAGIVEEQLYEFIVS